MNDTPEHIARKLCEIIQQKTPQERYEMGWSMYFTSKFLVIRAIMEEFPECSQAELKKEFFLRFYRNDFNEAQKEKILCYLEKHSSKEPAKHGFPDFFSNYPYE